MSKLEDIAPSTAFPVPWLYRVKVTLHAALFPVGGEVVGLGLNLAVGDTIVEIAARQSADWDGGGFLVGKAPVTGTSILVAADGQTLPYDGTGDDGGPYSGKEPANYGTGLLEIATYDGNARGPFLGEVLVAHELAAKAFLPATTGTMTLRIYVLPAIATLTLPDPV